MDTRQIETYSSAVSAPTVDQDGKVIFAAPCELLFTEDWKKRGGAIEGETEEWFRHNRVWVNLPIARLRPHRDLFEFFRGLHAAGAVPYLQWYQKLYASRNMETPLSDPELLNKRFDQFSEWDHLLHVHGVAHPKFVLDAKFDHELKTLMLLDGHHRSSFLRTSGCRQIMVRTSEEDYRSWVNGNAVQRVRDVIAEQQRKEFYTPILHPDFYDRMPLRDFAYKSRLDHILEFLGPYRFSGRLVDIGSNAGFFAHHFSREGYDVTGYDPDRNHHDLAVALTRLYQLSTRFENEPFEEANPTHTWTGAILFTVLYHFIAWGKAERLLKKIDDTVESFVLWESGSNPQEEKDAFFRHTKFTSYQRIADTFGTGRTRELGIFMEPKFASQFANDPLRADHVAPDLSAVGDGDGILRRLMRRLMQT
jgi:SAM-dependent methyltransferase